MIEHTLARMLHACFRSRSLATQIAGLPRSYPFTGGGTLLHPLIGRLNSRGAYAPLAFHLQLYVQQIRLSVEVDGRP